MSQIPFYYRVLALVCLLSLIAAGELIARGRAATRWREYAAMLGMGCLGALFGGVNDFVTVSISPEYFSLGKELGEASGLTGRAVALGGQAGFAAGIVMGGIFLYASTAGGGPSDETFSVIVRQIKYPFLLAIAMGMTVGLTFRNLAASEIFPRIATISASGSVDFFTVWGIHIGLYLGALLGLIAGTRNILASRGAGYSELLSKLVRQAGRALARRKSTS